MKRSSSSDCTGTSSTWSGSSSLRSCISSEVTDGNRRGNGNGKASRGGEEAPLCGRLRRPCGGDPRGTERLQPRDSAPRDHHNPGGPRDDQGKPCRGVLYAPAIRAAVDRADPTRRTRARRRTRRSTHSDVGASVIVDHHRSAASRGTVRGRDESAWGLRELYPSYSPRPREITAHPGARYWRRFEGVCNSF